MDNQPHFISNIILFTTSVTITIIIVATVSTLPLFNYEVLAQTLSNTNNTADDSSEQVHGGGIGYITCPDGSSSQANIAFVVFKSNGKISTANWSINELSSVQNPSPGFVIGNFNVVNLSSHEYKISGQKVNESQFCEPPVSIPITISGACGQNVAINVKFESNDPILNTNGQFTGDVLCKS
jgi:hypothetical protein